MAKSVKSQMRRNKRKALKAFNNAAHKTIIDVTTQSIRATPVDEGITRSQWRIGRDAPDTTVTQEAETIDQTIARVSGDIVKIKQGDLYVTNSGPAAKFLEDGLYPNPPQKGSWLKDGQVKHNKEGPGYFKFSENGFSKQAPNGIVRPSLAKFDQALGSAAKELKRDLKKK